MAYIYNLGRSPSSSPRSPRPTFMEIRPAVTTTLASSSSSSSTARQLFPPDAHQFGQRCAFCRKEPHPNEPRINGITSPCHHIFCHECMLQWILLSKKTVCPLSHCACELTKVILTKHCPKSRAELVGLMKSFEGKRKGAIERYDSLVYYEGPDILDEIKRLMKFNCCNYNFNNMNGVLVRNEMIWDRQKLHMKQMHKESVYCKLCVFNLPNVFPSEFELYCDATALDRHFNKPDLVSGHTVFHPVCTLCNKPERFFDNRALIEHCLENHYTCLVCHSAERFYLDLEALNEHVLKNHHVCRFCPSEEGLVGFGTFDLLMEHLLIEHAEQSTNNKEAEAKLKSDLEKAKLQKKPKPECESSFLADLTEPVPIKSAPEKVLKPVVQNQKPYFPQLIPKSGPQTPLSPTPPKGKWGKKKKRIDRKSLKVADLSEAFPLAPFGAILPALPVTSTGPSYSKIVQQNTVAASASTVLPAESSDLVAQEPEKPESHESSEVFKDAKESWPNGLGIVDSNNNNEDKESTAVSEPISTPRKRRNTYADIAASPPPVSRNIDEEEQAEEVIGVLSYEQIEALVDPGFSGSPESSFGSPEPTSSSTAGPSTTPTGAMTFSQLAAQASPSRRIRSVSSIQLQPTHFPDRAIGNDSAAFPRLGRRPSEMVDGNNNNNVLNYGMLGIRTNRHAHVQQFNRKGKL